MYAHQAISAHYIPESNIKFHQYLASFIFQFTLIGTKSSFFKNYFQKTINYFWDHIKDVQEASDRKNGNAPPKIPCRNDAPWV